MPLALRLAILPLLVLSLAACAPTRLETTWVEPGRATGRSDRPIAVQ